MEKEHSSSEESEELDPDKEGQNALEELIGLCKEALGLWKKGRSAKTTGGVNMLEKFIIKYENYSKSEKSIFSEHQAPFYRDIFNMHKKEIFNILESSTFLKKDIQVWIGKDNPRLKEKNIRLPISSCYSKACELRSEKEKELTGDADNDSKVMEETEFTSKHEIEFQFIRVIYWSIKDGKDKDRLFKIMNKIRPKTSIPDGETEVPGLTPMSIIKNVIEQASGGKIGNEVTKQVTDQFKNVANNKGFIDDLTGAFKETAKEDKPKSLGTALVGVVTRVAPKIDEMAETSNKGKEIPKGAYQISEDKIDENVEKTRQQLDNLLKSMGS